MLEGLKDFCFQSLYRLFGYIRPFPADDKLPSDDAVNKAAAGIVARENMQTIQKDAPADAAAAKVCVILFKQGGSACYRDIHDQGSCDAWRNYWEGQGKPCYPGYLAAKCPGGEKSRSYPR